MTAEHFFHLFTLLFFLPFIDIFTFCFSDKICQFAKLHWKAMKLWLHLLSYISSNEITFASGAALPLRCLYNETSNLLFAPERRQDIMIGPLLQTGSILTEATVQFILIMICLDLCNISPNSIVCKCVIYFDTLACASKRWNMDAGSI